MQFSGGTVFPGACEEVRRWSRLAGFGGVSFLSALFAYNFIVEMKGRSLEEIEMSLSPAAPGKRE